MSKFQVKPFTQDQIKKAVVPFSRPSKDDVVVLSYQQNNFDPSKIRIVIAGKYNKGWETISSFWRYLENGKLCTVLVAPGKRTCFGIQETHKYGVPQDSRTLETLEGIQLTLPLTSLDTVEKPTEEEAWFKYVVDTFRNFTEVYYNWLVENHSCESESANPDILILDSTALVWASAKKKKNLDMALKPFYQQSNKTTDGKVVKENGKTVKDPSKPLIMYIPFITYEKGEKLENKTLIYGPGDVQDFSGVKYKNTLVEVDSLILFKGLFFGAHMSQSWGASMQFAVYEANVVPIDMNSAPVRRLGPNVATQVENPLVLSPEEQLERDLGDDDDFVDPREAESALDKIDQDLDEEQDEHEELTPVPSPPKPEPSKKTTVSKKEAALKKKSGK